MGSPGTVSSSGRRRQPIPFGSPASVARSSDRDSMADRLESECLVQKQFKFGLITFNMLDMMGRGITVNPHWNPHVLETAVFESISPHPWMPVFLMGVTDEHIQYRIDKVRLVSGFKLIDQKPPPDPKKDGVKHKGKPNQIWLWGRYLNNTTKRYSTWHIRVQLNGTVSYMGSVPEDIKDHELSLDYTVSLTKHLVHKYLPHPVASKICSFEVRWNNICGNLQFNGIIQDPVKTAVKWNTVDGIRMSWEPEFTPKKLYITQYPNTPDYLCATPRGKRSREKSHISMTQTGYVEIHGAKSWEDMKVTVKATDQLLDEFVSQGDIVISGEFSSNPRMVDRVLTDAEMANNLTGGDHRLLHENMLDHFRDDDDQATIDAIDGLDLTPDKKTCDCCGNENCVMVKMPPDSEYFVMKSDGTFEKRRTPSRSPTSGRVTPTQLTPTHSTGDLRIDICTRTPTPEPEGMDAVTVEDVAVEAQLAAAAKAAADAAEKAETEAGQSRTPRAGDEPKSSFDFDVTPLGELTRTELTRTRGSLEDAEDASPLVKDAPPVDAQGSLSDDDEIKLVAEVKPKKKRGRGKEKPQREQKEPDSKKRKTVQITDVTGHTLEKLLTGVFPFTQAKTLHPEIGEDIYFRSFPRQRKKANGETTTTNDFQYVRYDKDQGKVVIFRGVDANGKTPNQQTGKGKKISESPFLRSKEAVTRWENLFLKGLIEDTTPAATVARAAPSVVRDVYEPTVAAADEQVTDAAPTAVERTAGDVAQEDDIQPVLTPATPTTADEQVTDAAPTAVERTADDVAQEDDIQPVLTAATPTTADVDGMFEHFVDDTESGEVPAQFDSHVTDEPLSTETPRNPPGMGDHPLEWTQEELDCLERNRNVFLSLYKIPKAEVPEKCLAVLRNRFQSQKTIDQVREKLIEMDSPEPLTLNPNYFSA